MGLPEEPPLSSREPGVERADSRRRAAVSAATPWHRTHRHHRCRPCCSFSSTATDFEAVPPGPVHASVNVLCVLIGPTPSLPWTALLPDHWPVARRLVAFVLDHVSVVDSPAATDDAAAVNVTVGGGGVSSIFKP